MDQYSNETFSVSATAVMNTFFIGLAGFPTLNISDSSTATRAHVIMTLVLDHSESMDPGCSLGDPDCTQGGTYLPGAVANFISVFEDDVDQAAMVSFGATSVTNVAMETPFKADITTAAKNMQWTGGTFSPGGLTNALAINNSVVVPTNVNAIKVVVFFTDGMANMIQNTLACPTGTNQTWNFGGWLDAGNPVGFWVPNATNTCASEECPSNAIPAGTGFTAHMTCGTVSCAPPSFCPAVTYFPSINGGTLSMTAPNIVTESQNRCIQVANQMRTNGMYVYSIGLASSSSSDAQPNPVFLQEVANDPLSPTYDSTLPTGQAVISGNGADLAELFQQIASDILLRLIH